MANSSDGSAALLVEMHKLRQAEPYRSAVKWFENEFRASSWAAIEESQPTGTMAHDSLRTVLEHWELVGALVDSGEISERLLFDSTGEHLSIWAKIEPWIHDARTELKNPCMFENVELLVTRHERYERSRAPKLARRAGQGGVV